MALLLLLYSIITTITTSDTPSIQTLWPIPAEFTNGTETITLCDYKNIKINSNLPSSPIIANATQRFMSYIQNAPEPFTIKPSSTINKKQSKPLACVSDITIQIASSNTTLSISTNENYTLNINSSAITIHSGSIYGTVYALITLSQLIRYNNQYSMNIIRNSPWYINDYPAFKYRGLMIDTGRNYLSVKLIKNTLLAMALNKMNVLHWHMIDAQVFPFYSTSHPELSEYGSYGKNKTYYPNDISNIVSYAKNLAIRIIPEFESPGHDTSIGFGDPDLMTCDSLSDNNGNNICYEPPCGYLNLLNQTAKQKIINLFNDLSKDSFNAFPDDVFHVGGDEVLPGCFGNETTNIYDEWMQNRIAFLKQNGKIPFIWSSEESLVADYGQNMNEVMMITYRCGNTYNCQNDKYVALKNGFKVIDADSNYYYLDCGLSNWLSPMTNTWCGPYRTWAVIYNHSLYDYIPKNESVLYKNLLGGELCQWGETVDTYNFEARVWVRSAAAAERW
eukprot:512152_1